MSLADAIRTEASSIASKASKQTSTVDQTAELVIECAETCLENLAAYGGKHQQILDKCEATLLTLVKTSARSQAQAAALNEVATRVPMDATPKDVYTTFSALVSDKSKAEEDRLVREDKHIAKLRKIIADADVAAQRKSGGASTSSAAEDADLGEDGIAMTQAARTTRCPLMQSEMTASGNLRPMKAPCGHCFSYEGITGYFKGKRGALMCPITGCNRTYQLNVLTEDKELIKQIKQSAQ